ncbi:MAG: hypothetical protein WCS70_06215 [Verrucomicrobiota bacterium]
MPAAFAADTNLPVRLELQLTDGSKIIGQADVKFRALELSSSSLGKLSIPVDRLRSVQIKTAEDEATVTLQNGDKVKGIVQARGLDLTTVFGKVSVPLTVIRELQVRPQSSTTMELQPLNADDWDLLPFPQDSDWPGDRGLPPLFENGEVVLRGAQDARTKKLYAAPLTIECEVQLERRTSSDGTFEIRLVAEGEPKNLDARNVLGISVSYKRDGGDSISFLGQNRRLIRKYSPAGFHLKTDKPYRVKLRIEPERLLLQVNDMEQEICDLRLPTERFYIQLFGWQPTDRWHVPKFATY